jgi:hypothetical protein
MDPRVLRHQITLILLLSVQLCKLNFNKLPCKQLARLMQQTIYYIMLNQIGANHSASLTRVRLDLYGSGVFLTFSTFAVVVTIAGGKNTWYGMSICTRFQ